MPRGRKWVSAAGRGLKAFDDLGSGAVSAAKELERRRQALIKQEGIITKAMAEVTQEWVDLEEILLVAQASGFSDEVVRDLRREARQKRIRALGTSSFARSAGDNNGIYKPISDIAREMADIEVEVYDALLRACDSRNPKDLEPAIASARYCQSLGEQALMMIPELIQRRKQKEEDDKRSCARTVYLVIVGIPVLFLVLVILLILLAEATCAPTALRSC